MATKTKVKLSKYGNARSTPIKYPEAASQSFVVGQLVTLDTAGRVIATATAGVLVIGIALEDASGTTDNLVSVDVILPGDLLQVTVYHATEASALLPNSSVGDLFQMTLASGINYLNIAGTSTNLWKIVGRAAGDSATDVYPKAIVSVVTACLQSVDAAQI